MANELIREYINCATVCANVDYADRVSVRNNNKAVDRMRAIVDEITSTDSPLLSDLLALLDSDDNDVASGWIAHHLVEMANLNSADIRKCFSKVEEMIETADKCLDGATALGERMWLEEWRKKRNFTT